MEYLLLRKRISGSSSHLSNFLDSLFGHLFIHLGYLYDSDRWNKLDGKHYFEICSAEEHMVADQFANSLLMPKSELIRHIDRIEDDQVNMTELAQRFNVPERIALIRCKELNKFVEEY